MAVLRCALIGVGGYGAVHLSAAQSLEKEGLIVLEAVAEAFPERCRQSLDELKARGVRVYDDYGDMLRREPALDMACIATPIHLHAPMALACFERGLHVFLEKPPAALVQDVDRMVEAAGRRGRLCQVGFQNVADPTAAELKRRLAAGAIGGVREVLVRGYWRRTDGYYARANWAGRLRVGNDWVLDGPANNPLCHYIHQALFLVCPREHDTLRPLAVEAEFYRAHPIEGEDILCARAWLEAGVVLLSYLTLCAPRHNAPRLDIVGERGAAAWTSGHWEVDGAGGRASGEAVPGSTTALLHNLVRAVAGQERLLSPIGATRNVVLHNNGCFKSAGKVHPVPQRWVRRYVSQEEDERGEVATEVDGLIEAMERAAAQGRLLSEVGVEWAVRPRKVTLDFDSFDPSPLLG